MKHKIPTTIYHTTGDLQEKLSGELTLSTREYLNYITMEFEKLMKQNDEAWVEINRLVKLKIELETELKNE